MVNTGFYGDIITILEKVSGLGIDFKYERTRRLPDDRIPIVKYGGGGVELQDPLTYGDVEVWSSPKPPQASMHCWKCRYLKRWGLE
jgi:hypothetical protein